MQEALVNRLGGLSLPRKSVVRLTDRPDMTIDVCHGHKTTTQQQQQTQSSQTSYSFGHFECSRVKAFIKRFHRNKEIKGFCKTVDPRLESCSRDHKTRKV